MAGIIKLKKSVIPACDVPSIEGLQQLVRETAGVKGIGAYKIGLELALNYGLKELVEVIRQYSDKPIIYDHQKAATDIPDLGNKFVSVCKSAGVDAIILFPQAGPATEKTWIEAAMEADLGVIVGGEMTHPNYLLSDDGFIDDSAPERMYSIAIELGVKDFVVPGNKPEKILLYKKLFESKNISAVLYAPGLIAQGGEITEAGKAAGERWHAIVGRAIYRATDIKKAAEELTKQLK